MVRIKHRIKFPKLPLRTARSSEEDARSAGSVLIDLCLQVLRDHQPVLHRDFLIDEPSAYAFLQVMCRFSDCNREALLRFPPAVLFPLMQRYCQYLSCGSLLDAEEADLVTLCEQVIQTKLAIEVDGYIIDIPSAEAFLQVYRGLQRPPNQRQLLTLRVPEAFLLVWQTVDFLNRLEEG
jgi:hypothetical protein